MHTQAYTVHTCIYNAHNSRAQRSESEAWAVDGKGTVGLRYDTL